MENRKIQLTENHGKSGSNGETVEVLYQRLGDRWFAFSLIEDEVFVGSISDEELGQAQTGSDPVHKFAGNS